MRGVISTQQRRWRAKQSTRSGRRGKIRDVSFEERVKWAAVLDEVPASGPRRSKKRRAREGGDQALFRPPESKGVKPPVSGRSDDGRVPDAGPAGDRRSVIRRLLGALTELLNNLGTVAIAIGMVLVCTDVLRATFSTRPSSGCRADQDDDHRHRIFPATACRAEQPHDPIRRVAGSLGAQGRRWGVASTPFIWSRARFSPARSSGVCGPQLIQAFRHNTFVAASGWVPGAGMADPAIILVGALLGVLACLLNASLGERKE